ncbi:hypothetical protein GS610_08080 [Ruegeria sp. HKCCD6228]|nr:hypothetical protein [Ruegeria sp. HKCCD6228]
MSSFSSIDAHPVRSIDLPATTGGDGLVVRRDCLTLWMLVSFTEYALILRD